MELQSETWYLVLHGGASSKAPKVVICRSLEEAIDGWTPNSRVSPVWPIAGYDCQPSAFNGKQTLLFLGPVQPARLPTEVMDFKDSVQCGLWATAGCFNIVLRAPDNRKHNVLLGRIKKWAAENKIAYEAWSLVDCELMRSVNTVLTDHDPEPLIHKISGVLKPGQQTILQQAFQEMLIVSATTLKRASAVYPQILPPLTAIMETICVMAQQRTNGGLSLLDMHGTFVRLNAALSRFSSQAFSGTPPIQQTECHFWIHSLLGTGSANIALFNLTESIAHSLGDARLPDRITLLDKKTDGVPDTKALTTDTALLDFDILLETDSGSVERNPIIPLITYFSGRDGFSSSKGVQTLSAPLTTLSECNSYRSNLLTATHEISHIYIRGALASLAPNLEVAEEISAATGILLPQFRPKNYLESAKLLFLEALAHMEVAARECEEIPDVITLMETWIEDAQEILVHAFDFLYFHESNPDFYVKCIWHSWCAIPGISDRIDDYLIRTLCAVGAKFLTHPVDTRFRASLNAVENILNEVLPQIAPNNSPSNYVDMALRRIKSIKADSVVWRSFSQKFDARLRLVRLVKIFLYSEVLSARLHSDNWVQSRKTFRKSKPKRKLVYTVNPIGNALNFLKDRLETSPTEAKSIWVLHSLAFNYQPATRGRT